MKAFKRLGLCLSKAPKGVRIEEKELKFEGK